MTHARRLIFDAAIAVVALTGRTVFEGLFFSLERSQLPCWVLEYSPQIEEVELVDADTLERQLRLDWLAVIDGADGASMLRTFDTMCEELETAFTRQALAAAGVRVSRVVLEATDAELEESDEGDAAMLQGSVTYLVIYQTIAGAPGAIVGG